MKNRISELLIKNGINPNKELFGMYFWEGLRGYELQERISSVEELNMCLEKCIGGYDEYPEETCSYIEEYSSRPYDGNGNELDMKVWMFTIDGVVVVVTDDEQEWYRYCAYELGAIMNDQALGDDKCRLWLGKKWLEMLDVD